MVPDTSKTFNPKKQLTRRDIKLDKEGQFALVTIKWSKTRQSGQVLTLPLMYIPNSHLCPVTAYKNMIKIVPGKGDTPLFKYRSRNFSMALNYQHFQTNLKHLVHLTGRDKSKYSTHSFRRGGATFAFQAGLPGEIVKLMGDWRSQAYLEYLSLPLETRTSAALLFSQHLSTIT
jgi:hypothetical protein